MSNEYILILTSILIICSSGAIINLTKNKNPNIKWQEVTKTLLFFKVAVPLTLISSLYFYNMGYCTYDQNVGMQWVGIFLVLCGLFFRWEAIRKLSGQFTVKVSIMEDHKLINTGVFKYIRHPSYLGMVMYFSGVGLMMHEIISLTILVLLPLSAIIVRIIVEEKALENHFKEDYTNYKKTSWRLIPLIF